MVSSLHVSVKLYVLTLVLCYLQLCHLRTPYEETGVHCECALLLIYTKYCYCHICEFLHYTIGHSVNTPCPNLKKLIVPASTAAMTTVLLPIFKDGNGFGGRAGVSAFVAAQGHTQVITLRPSDSSEAGRVFAEGFVGAFEDAAATFCCAKETRFRGTGGGSTGSSPNRAVSSEIVGIGEARAL